MTIDEHLNYIPELAESWEVQAFACPFFKVIEAVEPLDAHTIKFTLKYPTQTFLPTLAIHREGFLIKSPPLTRGGGGRIRTCIPRGRMPSSWPSGKRLGSRLTRDTEMTQLALFIKLNGSASP
jgi:hypothetical protein